LGREAACAEQDAHLLVELINAGHGISGLSIERPGLHDAFVRIVGAEALRAAEAEAVA
jgi:ABC-2 type transport system ATP-binding protein